MRVEDLVIANDCIQVIVDRDRKTREAKRWKIVYDDGLGCYSTLFTITNMEAEVPNKIADLLVQAVEDSNR